MPTQLLKDAINHYHQLLSEHLSSTEEILFSSCRKQNLVFGQRPVCNVLRPYFLDIPTYNFVCRSSSLVMQAVQIIREQLLSNRAMLSELDLNEQEHEIIQIDSGYGAPDVSARLDGFLSPTGEFHFVEYNAESPGGLAYGNALSEIFSSMPIMEEFVKSYNVYSFPVRATVFRNLLAAYHRWGGKGLPNIGIIDWSGVSTYTEFVLMKELFENSGCRVKIADPNELEYKNGKLVIGDFQIDLVYKRVLVDELLVKFGLNHPLIDAVRDRAVCVTNSFGVQLLYKKVIFALISDPANSHFFSNEVNQAIQTHIPWTRKVKECKTSYKDKQIDLVDFIADNKEDLVLKPNGEYGGKGVVLGWESSGEQWAETIKNALNSSYIVQERVPLGVESYPSIVDGELRFDERFSDLDPYVWNGSRVEWCGIRLSKLSLLNVTAGGGSATPMFLLKSNS